MPKAPRPSRTSQPADRRASGAGVAANGKVSTNFKGERREGKLPHAARQAVPDSTATAPFPIVGIGASAGGLEALEHFLSRVPKNSGMGFVIVQHLDPTRKGIMPELLQRSTGMKVLQVKDRTKVRPNCVYVIPPNKSMSILHGELHLLEPEAPR